MKDLRALRAAVITFILTGAAMALLDLALRRL
jgi:hypothetical protein